MNTHENQTGTWIQRIWWWIRDLYHQLKPCRFSFLVALIACPVFLCVAQGTEILRTVGEGMGGGQAYWPRAIGFFSALILWAICSWYTARVLLYFDLHGDRRGAISESAESHVPRILGVAPILIVGAGFLVASRSYDAGTSPWRWLIGFAMFCALLAFVFYGLLVVRRRWLGGSTPRNVKRVRDLSRGTFLGLGVIALISLVVFLGSTLAPVRFAQFIGMGTVLLLAASSWVALGGFFVFLGLRWRFPVISAALGLALLFSLWNDNHSIRQLPVQTVERADPLTEFKTWYDGVEKNYGAGTMHPLYIVATEGGGIRAAYWTAIVLGEIQDKNANFAPHLFAISGVSGGSLGATVFDALLAEPTRGAFKFKDKAHAILGQDFLSPALASMLYPDLVQRFLPFPIPCFDRGRALEKGWETAWHDVMGNDRFGDSFVDPLPMLAGATQSEHGRVFGVSPVDGFWELFREDDDGRVPLYRFSDVPRELSDFEEMNRYQQTSPESNFTRRRVCTIATSEGRVTLSGMRLILTKTGMRTERVLSGESELRECLREHFGVEFDKRVDWSRLIVKFQHHRE